MHVRNEGAVLDEKWERWRCVCYLKSFSNIKYLKICTKAELKLKLWSLKRSLERTFHCYFLINGRWRIRCKGIPKNNKPYLTISFNSWNRKTMYRYRIYIPSRQKLLDKMLIVKNEWKIKTIHLTSGLSLFIYSLIG